MSKKKRKTPKITPRGKYILVEPDGEGPRESEYGILTPDNVEQDKKAIGTVIAVGSEVEGVEKGDRVVYGMYAGEELVFGDTDKDIDYKLLHDDDVIAFIEN